MLRLSTGPTRPTRQTRLCVGIHGVHVLIQGTSRAGSNYQQDIQFPKPNTTTIWEDLKQSLNALKTCLSFLMNWSESVSARVFALLVDLDCSSAGSFFVSRVDIYLLSYFIYYHIWLFLLSDALHLDNLPSFLYYYLFYLVCSPHQTTPYLCVVVEIYNRDLGLVPQSRAHRSILWLEPHGYLFSAMRKMNT